MTREDGSSLYRKVLWDLWPKDQRPEKIQDLKIADMERFFTDNSKTMDSTSALMLNLNRLTENNTNICRSLRKKQNTGATESDGNPEEVLTRFSSSDELAGTG